MALIIDGHWPNAYWLWVLPLIAVEALLIVLCGFIASVLVCIKRDFALLINLGMLFLLFMSGVFWDLNAIGDPSTQEALLFWNPVAFSVAQLSTGPVVAANTRSITSFRSDCVSGLRPRAGC